MAVPGPYNRDARSYPYRTHDHPITAIKIQFAMNQQNTLESIGPIPIPSRHSITADLRTGFDQEWISLIFLPYIINVE